MKTIFKYIFLFFPIFAFSQTSEYDSLKRELKEYKLNYQIDSSDKSVLQLLEKLYNENLQTNKGLSKETLDEYQRYSESETLKNKSILFLFNKYQNYISETAVKGIKTDSEFQIAILKLLSGECLEIYKTIPAIVVIYMGEALINANMNEMALEHFKSSLSLYPNSIPIKVYIVLLDEENNIDLKNELFKENKKHWMVQKLLKK